MTKNLSRSFLLLAPFSALVACSAPLDEDFAAQHQAIGPCDPGDAACDEKKCSDDGTCPPKPCDDGSTDCGGDACAPQKIEGEGPCDLVLGYRWNGSDCEAVSGCSCNGGDCGEIFGCVDECKAKFAGCGDPPPPDDCQALAEELTKLLAEARACSIASTGAVEVCSALLPTIDQCTVPANATSPVLDAYKELFDKYAQSCPMPEIACPDPTGLAAACVQDGSVDGLIGVCSFVKDDATDPAAD